MPTVEEGKPVGRPLLKEVGGGGVNLRVEVGEPGEPPEDLRLKRLEAPNVLLNFENGLELAERDRLCLGDGKRS